MATKEAAQEAIKDPNPVIDGRKANVNLAYLGAKPRTAINALQNVAAASKIINKALDISEIIKIKFFSFNYRYSITFRCLSNNSNLWVSSRNRHYLALMLIYSNSIIVRLLKELR
jgi:hypothetical protein